MDALAPPLRTNVLYSSPLLLKERRNAIFAIVRIIPSGGYSNDGGRKLVVEGQQFGQRNASSSTNCAAKIARVALRPSVSG